MKLLLDDGTEIPISNIVDVGTITGSVKGLIVHVPITHINMPRNRIISYVNDQAKKISDFFRHALGLDLPVLGLPVINGEQIEIKAIDIGK